MKRNSFKIVYKAALLCCLVTAVSCKKVFDVKPQDQVDVSNAYQNVYDANAAVIGIYGQVLTIADKYIVVNELRADLMSPTANADAYLKQLNTHTETVDNPWVDPKPWYKIILSCNDAMYHFDDMLKTGKLKPIDYQQRYSDIGALRCWLYLQVATMYGTVPYVTDPLSNLSDLNDATKFPRLTLDQIVPKLAAFMNDPARYLDVYPTSDPITGATSSALNLTVDGIPTNIVTINKYALKGDVNLWAGNFTTASAAYHYLADDGVRTSTDGGLELYERYKVPSAGLAGTGNGSDAFYYTNSSETSLADGPTLGWRLIFADPNNGNDRYNTSNWIWRINFSTTFGNIVNPFINLFGAPEQGGSYLLMPSQSIINNWNSQIQTTGFPYDPRSKISMRNINGKLVIMKQLYNYTNSTTFLPTNILLKTGAFLINRTGAMQEHFAEAALNDGQLKVAYALHNVGMTNVFSPYNVNPITGASTIPSSFDPTNSEQSFLPAPYDFDARAGGVQNYHGTWYREAGTRTDALLRPLPVSYYAPGADPHLLEDAILDDNARELAFEGYRWPDLVRFARRRGDPSILANKVADKLKLEGNPAAETVRAKLMNPANWYMPFKM